MAFPTQSADFELSSSQSLTRADSASLSITGNITLETWVKFETLPSVVGGAGCRLLNKFHSGASNRGDFELYVSTTDKVGFIYSANGTYDAGQYTQREQDTATITSTGVWYHIKATAAPATQTITIYVDGSSVASTNLATGATVISDSGYEIGLGARNEGGTMGSFLDGRMLLARIWSELHSTDDKCTYFGGATTNMAAEWSLDNTLNDSSGNANTLTNNNVVTFSADVPSTCAVADGGSIRRRTLTGIGK